MNIYKALFNIDKKNYSGYLTSENRPENVVCHINPKHVNWIIVWSGSLLFFFYCSRNKLVSWSKTAQNKNKTGEDIFFVELLQLNSKARAEHLGKSYLGTSLCPIDPINSLNLYSFFVVYGALGLLLQLKFKTLKVQG